MSSSKRRLNQGQVDMLSQLYKFRFGNRELLANSLSRTNSNAIYSRLTILEREEYIAKRYDKSYKFAGRSAEYYLLPAGVRALKQYKQLDGLDNRAVKNSYNDFKASEVFVQRHLIIYKLTNALSSHYADLKLFTKRELTGFDYFPKRPLDGFITREVNDSTRYYFLELFMTDEPPFATDGRIKRLVAYYEDGGWDATGAAFPTVLCVAESGAIERRLMRQIRSRLNQSDTDIQFRTTTLAALLTVSTSDTIWSDVNDPDELIAL